MKVVLPPYVVETLDKTESSIPCGTCKNTKELRHSTNHGKTGNNIWMWLCSECLTVKKTKEIFRK